MKTIHLLESEDFVHPNDWCRPLTRLADYSSHSDTWMPSGTYDGRPLDHLKWVPLWLKLGKHWWGYRYEEYLKNKDVFPLEFVRGDIPHSHRLDLIQNDWHAQHPLWWETYLVEAEKIKSLKFNSGRHANDTVEYVKDYDYRYYEWYRDNMNNPLAAKLRFLHKFENHNIYYEPSYREYI